MTPTTPETVLSSVFGHREFRPLQGEAIASTLEGRDALVILPTGGGKSLCFQVPALLLPGMTLVISPLIALMKDQVEQLGRRGVSALYLNSSLGAERYRDHLRRIRSGSVKLLYVAPETLLRPGMLDLVAEQSVQLLAVDEAHCVSEWGHDFRPEYRHLAQLRRRFPEAVCLALTATATSRVRQDIREALALRDPLEFVGSFDRPNLFLEVQPRGDGYAQVLAHLKRHPGEAGIIYAFSRKQVDELAARLSADGFPAAPYHAGLEDDTRRRNQEAFLRNEVRIVVATIAFGMGIDKPDVRFVIHHDLPKSLEGYYQEIGRAGRDGRPAHCLLLFSVADVQKQKYFIDQKEPRERKNAEDLLWTMVRYAEGMRGCRRVPLLEYFGETYEPGDGCGQCDRCTRAPDPALRRDVAVPALKLLSCVKRTGERYGAAHVADVLLGSRAQRVRDLGHDVLSTHGIGRELSKRQWVHLAQVLVEQGYLEMEPEFRVLRLTPRAYEAFRDRPTILAELPPGRAAESPAPAAPAEALPTDPDLFDKLRAERRRLAREAGLPAFCVFADDTLLQMAATRPESEAALLTITGVGPAKLAKYGADFLRIIATHAADGPPLQS